MTELCCIFSLKYKFTYIKRNTMRCDCTERKSLIIYRMLNVFKNHQSGKDFLSNKT